MWMVQNTQIFVSKYLNFSPALIPWWVPELGLCRLLECKLKRVLVAANCRPGVKPLTSWQPPLVSQKCLCSTRSNFSTQGDLGDWREQDDEGEVSIIIFGMSESSGFQKHSICWVFQALYLCLCLCRCLCHCLCHCLCLCICVFLWFLNSFHHKLSEYVWL